MFIALWIPTERWTSQSRPQAGSGPTPFSSRPWVVSSKGLKPVVMWWFERLLLWRPAHLEHNSNPLSHNCLTHLSHICPTHKCSTFPWCLLVPWRIDILLIQLPLSLHMQTCAYGHMLPRIWCQILALQELNNLELTLVMNEKVSNLRVVEGHFGSHAGSKIWQCVSGSLVESLFMACIVKRYYMKWEKRDRQ